MGSSDKKENMAKDTEKPHINDEPTKEIDANGNKTEFSSERNEVKRVNTQNNSISESKNADETEFTKYDDLTFSEWNKLKEEHSKKSDKNLSSENLTDPSSKSDLPAYYWPAESQQANCNTIKTDYKVPTT